jgi:predicted ferric reductase
VSARRTRGGLFALAVLVNSGVLVWLWLHGGGVSDVHDWAMFWTSAGRITGLYASYLSLIEVLLLARIPWLERLVGFDKLTNWHRWNGHAVVTLVIVHTLAITEGYALQDRRSFPGEFAHFFEAKYPGMVTATVGTVLTVLVGWTSFVIVRRKLAYEWWYLVHLTVYAGIALAWFHQIPTGNEFVIATVASWYWRGLYLATLAAVVLWRLLVPAWQVARYRLRVSEVVAEAPGVVSIHLTGRNLDRLGARGGQFFLWRFLTRGRWWKAHPFSLSAAPDDHSLRITVKGVGDDSAAIASVPVGTRVVAEGPLGVFTADRRTLERVALIAGGIGITPIRAMLDDLGGDVVVVVYRVLRDEDVVFRDELARLGVPVHYVVGDHAGPGGERLASAEHLLELVPDLAEREVYVCGPPALTDFVVRNVRRAGVPRARVHAERFAY